MGDCKSNMQKTPKGKKENWFKRQKDPMEVAKTFADHVDVCSEMVDRLISVKVNDTKNEGAAERPTNKLKEGLLKTMKINLHSVQNLIDQYADL